MTHEQEHAKVVEMLLSDRNPYRNALPKDAWEHLANNLIRDGLRYMPYTLVKDRLPTIDDVDPEYKDIMVLFQGDGFPCCQPHHSSLDLITDKPELYFAWAPVPQPRVGYILWQQKALENKNKGE